MEWIDKERSMNYDKMINAINQNAYHFQAYTSMLSFVIVCLSIIRNPIVVHWFNLAEFFSTDAEIMFIQLWNDQLSRQLASFISYSYQTRQDISLKVFGSFTSSSFIYLSSTIATQSFPTFQEPNSFVPLLKRISGIVWL